MALLKGEGTMEQLVADLQPVLQLPGVKSGLIMAGAVLAALLSRYVFLRVILALVSKTNTDIDDRVALVVRGPVFYSFILAGLALVVLDLDLEPTAEYFILGAIKTMALLIWYFGASRVVSIVLGGLSRSMKRVSWIQPKTLPLFEISSKVIILGGAFYLFLVSWNIDVTSWVASAGVVGIAVGFAAKDTLANLFAGVFILADTPYKIGDFVNLDNQVRGRVTDIGVRSTRVLTRDDMEVTVPNALIANAQIINEAGGRDQKMRVRVSVSVAYGSDTDQVREVLLSCVNDVEHLVAKPEPRVRFREFGDSGLRFELLAWIEEPVYRGRVIDALNTRIYKAFNEAGIEIPYSKHDLYLKEMPGSGSTTSSEDR
jgi:MscS family membrane protein